MLLENDGLYAYIPDEVADEFRQYIKASIAPEDGPRHQLEAARKYCKASQIPPGEHYMLVNSECLKILMGPKEDLSILDKRLEMYGMKLIW